MRVWCDFNAGVDDGRYVLNCVGTIEDLRRQNIELQDGLALTLYMDDPGDDGLIELTIVDAVVEAFHGHFVARVRPGTWRHETVPPAVPPAR